MPLPVEHVQQLAGLAQAYIETASVLRDTRFAPALNGLIDTPQDRILAASAPGNYLVSKGISNASGLHGTYSESISANGDTQTTPATRDMLFGVCRSIAVTVDGKTNFVTICFGFDSQKGITITIS